MLDIIALSVNLLISEPDEKPSVDPTPLVEATKKLGSCDAVYISLIKWHNIATAILNDSIDNYPVIIQENLNESANNWMYMVYLNKKVFDDTIVSNYVEMGGKAETANATKTATMIDMMNRIDKQFNIEKDKKSIITGVKIYAKACNDYIYKYFNFKR